MAKNEKKAREEDKVSFFNKREPDKLYIDIILRILMSLLYVYLFLIMGAVCELCVKLRMNRGPYNPKGGIWI